MLKTVEPQRHSDEPWPWLWELLVEVSLPIPAAEPRRPKCRRCWEMSFCCPHTDWITCWLKSDQNFFWCSCHGGPKMLWPEFRDCFGLWRSFLLAWVTVWLLEQDRIDLTDIVPWSPSSCLHLTCTQELAGLFSTNPHVKIKFYYIVPLIASFLI